MGTFTNIDDSDVMPHDAAFHQGLHCFNSRKDLQAYEYNNYVFEKYNLTPLITYNRLSQ